MNLAETIVTPDSESHFSFNPADTFSDWDASLHLRISKTPRGSRLTESRHQGPLYVQKPFYPEGPELAHIYLLHPPGGMVSGDSLNTHIQLDEQAGALFTTPGAGRIYRARPDRRIQAQTTQATLSAGSTLEWLPLETLVYPGAIGAFTTRINLNAHSRFIAWEITCMGLPASGAHFEQGEFTQTFQVFLDDSPLLNERLNINAMDLAFLSGRAGLQNFPVSGLIAAGPFVDQQVSTTLMEKLRELNTNSPEYLLACTGFNNLIVVRYLGHCAAQARAKLTECWQILRPDAVGRSACSPRIWAC